jgi:hypothetical protein
LIQNWTISENGVRIVPIAFGLLNENITNLNYSTSKPEFIDQLQSMTTLPSGTASLEK